MVMKDWSHLFIVLMVATGFCSTAHADEWNSGNYKPDNRSIKIGETNLPIVFIDTRSGGSSTKIIHKDYRIAARMKIINNADGIQYDDTLAHPGQEVDYEGWIAIRYRGNSSFNLSDKKPYSIKTMETSDPNGEKQKVALLGMAKDNDWVMLAPYADRSMIRDVLMFELARPYFEYTPTAKHCELILDGTYYGVYILSERACKSKHRLDLDMPGDSGDELTGGYQLTIDRNDEYPIYVSKHATQDQNGQDYWWYNEVYFQYKHPEFDEMIPSHPSQLTYIQRQIDAMEDALASDDFQDTETGYPHYIDVTNFIDQQLSQEVSHNVDGYRLSTNIYKRRDSVDPRFKTTLWDFNIAFGNANYYNAERTDTWMFENNRYMDYGDANKVPFWWKRLMKDPAYVKAMKNRWGEYRQGNYSNKHITQLIDSLVDRLEAKGARERNFKAWPRWNRDIWPVPNWHIVNTYAKEINALRQWITRRLKWMDKQLEFDPTGTLEPTTEFAHEVAGIYDLQGIPLSRPRKGVILVRYKDGTSRKVVIR